MPSAESFVFSAHCDAADKLSGCGHDDLDVDHRAGAADRLLRGGGRGDAPTRLQ